MAGLREWLFNWSGVNLDRTDVSATERAGMMTVAALIAYYLRHLACKRPDAVLSQMKHPLRLLGDIAADALRGHHLAEYRATRRIEGAATATRNRELVYLRAAFRRCMDDELVERMPRFRMEPELRREVGWCSRDEMETIAAHIGEPLGDVVRMLFFTGWRKQAILGLPWTAVSWDSARITLAAESSKCRQFQPFPIEGAIGDILRRRQAAALYGRQAVTWIFHRDGRRIGDFRKAWMSAKAAAGIEESRRLRIHDLRASFVLHMLDAGAQDNVIMELAQMSRQTFDRYRRLRVTEMRDAVRAAASLANPATR